MSGQTDLRAKRHGETIAWLGLICTICLTACPTRSFPTAPEVSSESSLEAVTPVPRMPIVHVARPRRLSSFTPNATPTPTSAPATATRTPSSSTPTRTPPPPTPTRTPASPTPTLTPTPGVTLIRLRAVRWAWQWIAGPGTTPGNPSPSITLKSGQTYSLHVFDGDIDDGVNQPHAFSGILEFSLSGVQLQYYAPDVVQTFTTPVVTQPTTYGFSCTDFYCGPVTRHEGMLGTVVVTP